MCGWTTAPSNGPPSSPVSLGVSLGQEAGVTLQPLLRLPPRSTFRALRARESLTGRAAANFSPVHAGSPARTLVISIGLWLDFVQLEEVASGVVRPPFRLPVLVALSLLTSPPPPAAFRNSLPDGGSGGGTGPLPLPAPERNSQLGHTPHLHQPSKCLSKHTDTRTHTPRV